MDARLSGENTSLPGDNRFDRAVAKHREARKIPTLKRQMEKIPRTKISPWRKKRNRRKTFRNNPENRKPGQGNSKPATSTTAIGRVHRGLAFYRALTTKLPKLPQRTPDDLPGTSRCQPVKQYNRTEITPMEEREISSDSELAPSVLEVPTINWANYVGVKSVQYIKMGHAARVQALEQNNWKIPSEKWKQNSPQTYNCL